MVTNPEIIAELEEIASRNAGCLKPEAVVEAARVETSPLHSWFDWEDSDAAHKWRLHQARQLIRVTVTYVGGEEKVPMRVFVSLTPDRQEGGYRATAAVMSDAESRKQLLADALDELERVQQKYSALQELADVFSAIKRAKREAVAA